MIHTGLDIYFSNINKCLRTLVSQFYYRPHLFFNEVGFHTYCFSVFYRNPLFTKVFKTQDGKLTNLVHPEYRSVMGKQGGKEHSWYDMVILDPQFIENNSFERVANNNIVISHWTPKDLLAVFEFKFIREHSKHFIKQLEKDYNSLSNAKEAIKKYMIVFSLSRKNQIDYFREMIWDDKLMLIYTTVYFENKKKKIEVSIKPNNFLNLSSGWLKT